MKRLCGVLAVGVLGLAACGGDDDGGAATTDGVDTTAAASATTAVMPPDSSSVDSTSSAPNTSGAAPESTTANEGRAAAALLTPTELTGWAAQPEDDDDDAELAFDPPECAQLQAVEDLPGMEDDAEVKLVSPDTATEVNEQVTVGDPASVQTAFDTFADPQTATCLTTLFTTLLSQPGAMPDGVTLSGIQFAQQPMTGGDQAVGYVATITVTGEQTGVTAPIAIRFDAVRTGDAIALLMTITTPGGAPVDAAVIVAAAGEKMRAAA
ncbi:MAG: hypothetical protein AB7L17_02445 [Ilumatobacteraceae bacterium]